MPGLGRPRHVSSVWPSPCLTPDTIRLLVNPPIERQSPWLMRAMFHTVAPRYDFITRAFSYGMDGFWKRTAIDKIDLPPGARVLDLACGTGDFSLLVRDRYPGSRPVAA